LELTDRPSARQLKSGGRKKRHLAEYIDQMALDFSSLS